MTALRNYSLFVFCAFLIGAHVYLGLGSIRQFAPTYDEPVHLTAGYVYWKTGDYRFNGYHHPPLAEMWAAFPLLFLNPTLPVQRPEWINQEWRAKDQYG